MTESKWTKESLDEAFRPYLEHENDTSPQGRRRARVLRAATELFETQGYRKTSVEDIARRAEVAKGTVYLYFESKGALLVHAIALQKKALLSSLEPLFTGAIPERERLRYYVKLVLTSAREVPLAARLISGDAELSAALEDIGEAQVQQNQAQGELWMGELIELAAPGVFSDEEKRLRADGLMTLGYFSGMLLDERLRFGRSLEEMAEALADMFVYGAAHRPPGPPPDEEK
jgi:AcrR family transcriptional regulator